MYSVGVRDHIMVAHSLAGEVFGPAQRLHGATYTVSVEVEREELGPDGILCDIGMLRSELRAVLDGLDYQNLDEHPAFPAAPPRPSSSRASSTARSARACPSSPG